VIGNYWCTYFHKLQWTTEHHLTMWMALSCVFKYPDLGTLFTGFRGKRSWRNSDPLCIVSCCAAFWPGDVSLNVCFPRNCIGAVRCVWGRLQWVTQVSINQLCFDGFTQTNINNIPPVPVSLFAILTLSTANLPHAWWEVTYKYSSYQIK